MAAHSGIEHSTTDVDAPAWLPRCIVIILAIGLIPALIFSWVFELTPEGLKRDAEVKPEESIAPQTARRMDRMIIAILICALVYFGFDKFVLAPRRETALVTQTEQSLTTRAAASQHAQNDKSIAVLPFENLSEDKANAYFATGMQDEILTRLAGIHDLKVISRTSTEQYASRPPNLKIVAEQLGVASVLEGSVQRADGKVRINLQLIDARTDSHLWAQNYDRDLKDVVAVQSDVAEKVADALQAKLLPAESTRIASVPTKNPEAYDLFLKAEDFARELDSSSAKDLVDAGHKAEASVLRGDCRRSRFCTGLRVVVLSEILLLLARYRSRSAGDRCRASRCRTSACIAAEPAASASGDGLCLLSDATELRSRAGRVRHGTREPAQRRQRDCSDCLRPPPSRQPVAGDLRIKTSR